MIVTKVILAGCASHIWFKGTASRTTVDVQSPLSLLLPELSLGRHSHVTPNADVINFLTNAVTSEAEQVEVVKVTAKVIAKVDAEKGCNLVMKTISTPSKVPFYSGFNMNNTFMVAILI